MTHRGKSLAMLIAALAIFGTNGVVVRLCGLPSSVIASVRGLIGAVTLVIISAARGEKISFKGIAPGALARIALTGACMGINWVLLFEAFRTASVAISTVVYYIAPALVVAVSPFILHERFSPVRFACVLVSFAGLALITGFDGSATGAGIACALGAAVFYASVIMLNTTFADVDYRVRTIIELGVAGVVVLPYALATGAFAETELTLHAVIYLLILGTVYTGIAYALYFAAFSGLEAQEVSVLSYIDPVIAVICSAIVLTEPLTPAGIVGAVLIIGSSIVSEVLTQRGAS